jgi:hypothetical protein
MWNLGPQANCRKGEVQLLSGVLSKLKCPVFLAHDMSGFMVNQQQSGLWESGNPAGFAGFPSEVGKSGL